LDNLEAFQEAMASQIWIQTKFNDRVVDKAEWILVATEVP
jgi:hypothetical protein